MYFVYIHIREDNGEVFYVGKGTCILSDIHKRKYYRAYEINNRSYVWLKVVDETDYRVEIVFDTENEGEALEKERELIRFYKPKLLEGTLVNIVNFDELYFLEKETLTSKIKNRLGYTVKARGNLESPEPNAVMDALSQL